MDFYVYLHRKATTGEIFYVGKGQGNRAWSHSGRSQYWRRLVAKHGHVVEIVASGLQEWYAFELECNLIALYGRRDKGLGNLANLTDGGEGASGRKVSADDRARSQKVAVRQWQEKAFRDTVFAALKRGRQTQSRRVECLELKACFFSIGDAAAFINETFGLKLQSGHISSCLNSPRRASVKGFTFVTPGKTPYVPSLHRTCVVACATNIIFRGQRDALVWANQNGLRSAKSLNSGLLNGCLKGKKKSAYGSTWRYATPEEATALKEKGTLWAPLSDLRLGN